MSSTSRSLKRSPSFPTETLYAVLFSFVGVRFSAYLTRMIFGEQYKSLSSSLYSFLHSRGHKYLSQHPVLEHPQPMSRVLKSFNVFSVYKVEELWRFSLLLPTFPILNTDFFDVLLYTASNRRSGGVLGKEFKRYMCYDTTQESPLFGRKMCLAFFSKTSDQKIFLFGRYLASYYPGVQG